MAVTQPPMLWPMITIRAGSTCNLAATSGRRR